MTKRTSGELKRLAREFLMGNYTLLILAALITTIIPAALLFPFTAGVSDDFNFSTIIYYIAVFIISILSELFTVSITRIHMQLAKKQNTALMDVFWTFKNRPDRFILGILLFGVLLLLSLLPLILFSVFFPEINTITLYIIFSLAELLLLIPAVLTGLTYSLIYPLYIDHPELSVIEGFRLSRTLMYGNKKRLFVLYLSFIGWLILGLCSFGIGMLWISPYIAQTKTNFYLDITRQFDLPAEHIDATIMDEATHIRT